LRDFCKAGDGTRDSINPDSVRIDRAGGPYLVAAPIPLMWSCHPPKIVLPPLEIPIQFESHWVVNGSDGGGMAASEEPPKLSSLSGRT